MIKRWLTMAGEGCEIQAWNEITRYTEGLPEERVEALIEELVAWPGRRPMPYRWWEQRRRGDWRPWHQLADHRVVYVDPEMLYDPDEYEAFDGGPVVDGENRPDFSSGIDVVGASSDLRWLVLTTSAQGNHESGDMWLFDAETGRWDSDGLEDERHWIGWGNDAAFAPDGSRVAVATTTDLQTIVWRADGMTRLWAAGQQSGAKGTTDAWKTGVLATDEEFPRDKDDRLLFSHVGFSGDGLLLSAVSAPYPLRDTEAADRRIVVAVAQTGEVVFATTAPVRGGAVLDHTGQKLAHVGGDGEVLVYDVPSGAIVARHRTSLPTARTLVFASDGDAIAVGGEGAVEVIRPGLERSERFAIKGTCQALNWSLDTVRALVTEEDCAAVVDGAGSVLWAGQMEHPSACIAAFTPDGRALVTVDDSTSEVIAWFLDGGHRLRRVDHSV